MRNYFVLNGVDSRDFGVYISGQGTFSAPQKAYQFYQVPGRNGAIIGFENRLENVELTYKAFIYSNFDENIAAFRGFLLALDGYQRLEDSYHPDEFRLACYTGSFDPAVTKKNDAGSFDLKFICKPQRYLKSGETTYTWIANQPDIPIRGKQLEIDGTRLSTNTPFNLFFDTDIIGSGTPSPSNPYAFLFPLKLMQVKIDGDAVYTATVPKTVDLANGVANLLTGTLSITKKYYQLPSSGWSYSNGIYTLSSGYPGTATAICTHYKPYTLTDNDFSIDCSNGEIQIRDSRFSSGLPLPGFTNFLKSNAVYVIYTLASPATSVITQFTGSFPERQFTLTSIQEAELAYSPDPVMINPSLFPSQPLIRIYGEGAFSLNDVSVQVTDCVSYVDVDCELMDCYEGSTNRNKDVIFGGYDFPELKVGKNMVTFSGGVTRVDITPRWWRV